MMRRSHHPTRYNQQQMSTIPISELNNSGNVKPMPIEATFIMNDITTPEKREWSWA